MPGALQADVEVHESAGDLVFVQERDRADKVRVADEGVLGKILYRVAFKTRIGAEVELRHECFVTRCPDDVVDVLSYAVGVVAGHDASDRVFCGARQDETFAVVLAFEVIVTSVIGLPNFDFDAFHEVAASVVDTAFDFETEAGSTCRAEE